MKKYLFISTIYLLSIFACEEPSTAKQRIPPAIVADCLPEGTDFRFAYDNYVKQRNSHFFIKGKVSETIPSGLIVKPVEDLKGNYSSNSLVTIWFGGDAGLESSVQYYNYNENDTLLIICSSAVEYGQEYANDLVMLSCSPSSLRVSGEYVSGYIYAPYTEATVLWSELLAELNE